MINFIGPPNALAHDMMKHMLDRHGILQYTFNAPSVPSELQVLVGEQALADHCNVHEINDYRGSIMPTVSGCKCVAIKYPSDAYYNGVQYAILDMDFSRIVDEAKKPMKFPELPWDFITGDSVTEAIVSIFEQAEFLAVDIESVKATQQIICVGFAMSPWKAISIYLRYDHERMWIARLLRCNAKKIFHFGSFDTTMLELSALPTENYTDDTIIQAHVLAPELPRDLGFLSSIYTRIPYFKSEGRTNIPGDAKAWSAKRDKESLLTYNCKDCCATFQIWQAQRQLIEEDPDHSHIYAYEMEMIPVAREIGMNGMLLDAERNYTLKEALRTKQQRYQEALTTICNGVEININSPKQVQLALYEGLGLPKKYKPASKKQQEEGIDRTLTSDNDALISLISTIKTELGKLKTEKARRPWEIRYHFVTITLLMRGVNKLLSSYIEITTHNGRVKSLYKVPGTETGRWSCSKFIDDTGLNAQTLPREAITI